MAQRATTKYRIRNWAKYNKTLVQRGSLTIWLSEGVIEKWLATKEGKRGHPQLYSDEAILCTFAVSGKGAHIDRI